MISYLELWIQSRFEKELDLKAREKRWVQHGPLLNLFATSPGALAFGKLIMRLRSVKTISLRALFRKALAPAGRTIEL